MRIKVVETIFLLVLLEVTQVLSQAKCPPIKSPKNGRVRLRARGRLAKFRCWRKYTLLGPKAIFCSNNKWGKDPPICVRKGCDDITVPSNITVIKSVNGAVLDFKCLAPYRLIGEKRITCDGKEWSTSPPTCEHVEPSNTCDFEDEDLCGWSHDNLGNFKWRWHSGTTPTRGTGPLYDHTFGKSGNGHYMYMESSSPVKTEDKARMFSPYYGATTREECFEFWYHMHGKRGLKEIGTLNVYVEEMGVSYSDIDASFSISGYQGEEWRMGSFAVGLRTKSFRFVIEGIKGKSYLGDISIDDTKLYNCSEDTTLTEDTSMMISTSMTDITTESFEQETTQDTAISTITEKNVATTMEKIKSTLENKSVQTFTTAATTVQTAASPSTILPSSTTGMVKKTTSKAKITTPTHKTTPVKTTKPTIKNTTHTTKTTVRTTTPTTKTTVRNTTPTTKSTVRKTRPTTNTTVRKTTPTTKTTVKKTRPTAETTARKTTPTAKTTVRKTTPTAETTERKTTPAAKTTVRKTTPTSKTSVTKTTPTKNITKRKTKPTTTTPTTTTEKVNEPTTKKRTRAMKSTTTKRTKPTTKPISTTTASTTATSFTQQTTTKARKTTKRSTLKPKTTAYTTITSKSTQTGSTTTLAVSAENTTKYSAYNITVDSIEKIQSTSPLKPLMIGIGVGVAIGLIIVFGAIYIYIKKRRKDDIFEDEMEPIAKNAVYD